MVSKKAPSALERGTWFRGKIILNSVDERFEGARGQVSALIKVSSEGHLGPQAPFIWMEKEPIFLHRKHRARCKLSNSGKRVCT